jgi:CubicO group peptidase (beta-lactamase class C family)
LVLIIDPWRKMSSQNFQPFAESIDKAVESGKVPGVAIAAIDKSGSMLFSHTSGPVNVIEPAKGSVGLDSVFALASCTKLVTTVAALQCVDRGWVTLDAALDEHLPELTSLDLIGPKAGDETGYVLSTPQRRGISLRELLTHTSGVAYDMLSPQLSAWQMEHRGQPSLAFSGKFFGAMDVPVIFERGQSWMYGAGLDWAGVLVGRLSGMSFGEYCTKNIFEPLGMSSTTFHLETNEDIRGRLVAMSTRTEQGSLVSGGSQIADPAEDDLGGIGLYSSASDYLRLLGDLVREKPTVLSLASVEEMFTPQLQEDGQPLAVMKQLGPLLYGFYMSDAAPQVNHGLGAILTTGDNASSGTPEGVLRWSGYTGPLWAMSRKLGVAWLFATQITPFGDKQVGSLAEDFSRLVFSGAA